MRIGEKIKELRTKYGMTQTELGDRIGESKQTIYKYETGVVTNIPLANIEKIAEVFHVSPSALTGWSRPLSMAELDSMEKGIYDLTDRIRFESDADKIAELQKILEVKHMEYGDAIDATTEMMMLPFFQDKELEEITTAARKLTPDHRQMLLKYMQFTFPEAFE